ncbi:adenylate kinase, partial [Musa troglodytarum]
VPLPRFWGGWGRRGSGDLNPAARSTTSKRRSKPGSAAMSGIHRLGALAARSLARRVFAPPPMHRRSFGAAALAEVEYWTEWEEEEHGRYAAAAATDACGEREPRRVQWVFMGSPGVQRHVYATRVAELLDVPYISMGSLIRQELNPSSSLYKKINVVLGIFCLICGLNLVIVSPDSFPDWEHLFRVREGYLRGGGHDLSYCMARPRNLRGVMSSFSGNSCLCAALGFLKLSVAKHLRTDGVEEEEIEARVSRHGRDPPLRRPRSTIPCSTGSRRCLCTANPSVPHRWRRWSTGRSGRRRSAKMLAGREAEEGAVSGHEEP